MASLGITAPAAPALHIQFLAQPLKPAWKEILLRRRNHDKIKVQEREIWRRGRQITKTLVLNRFFVLVLCEFYKAKKCFPKRRPRKLSLVLVLIGLYILAPASWSKTAKADSSGLQNRHLVEGMKKLVYLSCSDTLYTRRSGFQTEKKENEKLNPWQTKPPLDRLEKNTLANKNEKRTSTLFLSDG